MNSISKDDKVEILATFLGSFMLGGSFAKDFFLNGRFEIRIFLFGLSPFILLFIISRAAEIRIQFYHSRKKWTGFLGVFFFLVGTVAAIDLFRDQFIVKGSGLDIRTETLVFLAAYTISTNLLCLLNRETLFAALNKKTI